MFPRLVTARLRVTVDCTECAYPIPVNGIVPSVLCLVCHAVVPLEGDLAWSRIMRYASREPVRSPTGGLILSKEEVSLIDNFLREPRRIHRRWEDILVEVDPRLPTCAECRTEMDPHGLLDVVAQGVTAAHCPGCAAIFSLRAAEPLRQLLPSKCAVPLAIAAESALTGELSGTAGAELVLFSCLGCGASLKVDAAVPRMLTCEYCSATSYIPDALWLRMHPGQRKRAFFVLLQQNGPASV